MNLQDAFSISININFGKKKKKKKMQDAYESFLKGNWSKLKKSSPKTFGSLG